MLVILIIYLAGCSTKNNLPIAQFTITPDNGRAPLSVNVDADTSSDSDGEISSYKWDFGNGDSKEGKKAEYSFTQAGEYKVTLTVTDDDGGEHSADKTVTVTKNSVPVANSQELVTKQSTNINIVLTASDSEGDDLTYTIKDSPENGILTGDAFSVSYQPNDNFVGTDQFTFKVNDGYDDSNLATIKIAITDALEPNNSASQATDVTFDSVVHSFVNPIDDIDWFNFNLEEESVVRVNVRTKDIGSDLPVSVRLLDKDKNEIASKDLQEDALQADLTAGSYYVVLWNSTQSNVFEDSLTQQNLTQLASSNQFYDIEVTIISPANNPPLAKTQEVATKEDISLEITLESSDTDDDELTYVIVADPKNGALSGTPPNLTYSPDKDFTGEDSFIFKVNDGKEDSNDAKVAIQVVPVEKSIPVAESQGVTTEEDKSLNITLRGSDADGDDLTYAVVSEPTKGKLIGNAPDLIYTPDNNVNGKDSFTFKVNDGLTDSSLANVDIAIAPVNDAPVASSQELTAIENQTLAITLSATDIDSEENALSFSIATQPQHGTLFSLLPEVAYTPDKGFIGKDSFTFRANDGKDTSEEAEIVIEVIEKPNDAPVAKSQDVVLNEDASVDIVLEATDVDNDELTYSLDSQPINGKVTGVPPNITYTPNKDFNGEDEFSFITNDEELDSNSATVKITVSPINDVPVVNSQSIEVNEDESVSFTLIGSDVDGDTLTYKTTSPLQNGILSGNAPNLTYTPNANFNGSDGFSFKSNDGQVDSSLAQVNITVIPVDDPTIFPKESTCASSDIGETCTVTVALRENANIYKGFGFKVTTTPENFILKSDIIIGELPKDCFVAAIPSDDAVIGICQLGQEFTGNGTLLTLTFERKATGRTTFTISNPNATTTDNQTTPLFGESLVVN